MNEQEVIDRLCAINEQLMAIDEMLEMFPIKADSFDMLERIIRRTRPINSEEGEFLEKLRLGFMIRRVKMGMPLWSPDDRNDYTQEVTQPQEAVKDGG